MNSNISRPLRIALTKGRLEKDTVALLEKLGYDCTAVHEKGRKLILPVGDDIEVVLAKAADVITYVENGVRPWRCRQGYYHRNERQVL